MQGLVAGLANGSLTDTEQLGPALDKLLSGLLTSPAGNEVAGWLSDLLDKASAWLSTPIGGGSGSGSNGTASPGSGDLGSAIGSILSNITSTVDGIREGASNGTADAGQIAGSVVDGLGGIIGEKRWLHQWSRGSGPMSVPPAWSARDVACTCGSCVPCCFRLAVLLTDCCPPLSQSIPPPQMACWAPSPAAAMTAAPHPATS